MNTREHIARKIKELREQRGWKQSELGNMLDTPKGGGTVSSWEKGRTTPDADTLINLCRVFCVDISEFYPQERDGDFIPLSPDEEELLDCYRSVGKEEKGHILHYAKMTVAQTGIECRVVKL